MMLCKHVASRCSVPEHHVSRLHTLKRTSPLQLVSSLPRKVVNVFQEHNERRHWCVRATAIAESTDVADKASSHHHATTLTSAETARTLVDIVSHGTLCTIGDDGTPLGTYVTYILDTDGFPILRLRADAVHTRNLQRNNRCSLFVQPTDLPSRLLGRVTLIGSVHEVADDVKSTAAQKHSQANALAIGVDAPHASDLFYKLNLETCFFVGGMGSTFQAEVISAADYLSSEPDELRACATTLVFSMNSERPVDVVRISADALGARFEAMEGAELLWVDSRGLYINTCIQGEEKIIRVPFARQVSDERDARSALTMLAQHAWEKDRSYKPVVPNIVPNIDSSK